MPVMMADPRMRKQPPPRTAAISADRLKQETIERSKPSGASLANAAANTLQPSAAATHAVQASSANTGAGGAPSDPRQAPSDPRRARHAKANETRRGAEGRRVLPPDMLSSPGGPINLTTLQAPTQPAASSDHAAAQTPGQSSTPVSKPSNASAAAASDATESGEAGALQQVIDATEEAAQAGPPLPHPLDREPGHPSLAAAEGLQVVKRVVFQWASDRCLDCDAAFPASAPERVLRLIGDRINCAIQFNCSRRIALCNLHMLNRGQPPFLRLRAPPEPAATAAFISAFDSILNSSKDPPLPVCIIDDGKETTELVFVPVHSLDHKLQDGRWVVERTACFWGYRMLPGTVSASIKWLSMCRMPVVLDLDDTLVVAAGESSLRDRHEKNQTGIKQLEAQLRTETTEEPQAAVERRVQQLQKENIFLKQDLKMLREYVEDDCVTDENGKVHKAVVEQAYADVQGKQAIKRPVIRLRRGDDQFLTVFTRIDPANAATSMIIRIRAGWEALKTELLSPLDPADPTSPRKWDTYICTAAEQPYALEVCRLLDPENILVPQELQPNHLVCVSRDIKKSLKAALHHPLEANRYKSDAKTLVDPDSVMENAELDEEDTGAADVSTMAIAIIVDDRLDVWEASVKEQIVVANPFHHYPTAAAAALGDGVSNTKRGVTEIDRILNFLRGIRSDLFHFWTNILQHTVRHLLDAGIPNAFTLMDMHALMAVSPFVNVNSMKPAAPVPLAMMAGSTRATGEEQAGSGDGALPPGAAGAPMNAEGREAVQVATNPGMLAHVHPQAPQGTTVVTGPAFQAGVQGPPQTGPILAPASMSGLVSMHQPHNPQPVLTFSQPHAGAFQGALAPMRVFPGPQQPAFSAPAAATDGGHLQPHTGNLVTDPRLLQGHAAHAAMAFQHLQAPGAGVHVAMPGQPLGGPGAPQSMQIAQPAPHGHAIGGAPERVSTPGMLPASAPSTGQEGRQQVESDGLMRHGHQAIVSPVAMSMGQAPGAYQVLQEKPLGWGPGSNPAVTAAPGSAAQPARMDEDPMSIYQPTMGHSPAGPAGQDGSQPAAVDRDVRMVQGQSQESGSSVPTTSPEASVSNDDEEYAKLYGSGHADEHGQGSSEPQQGGQAHAHAHSESPRDSDDDVEDGLIQEPPGSESKRGAGAVRAPWLSNRAGDGNVGGVEGQDVEEYEEEWGGALPELSLEEVMRDFGQEGLPYILAKQEQLPDGSSTVRPVRVQQGAEVHSWAPFILEGKIIPAISIDSDPANRPECIILRVTPDMLDQSCPIEKNFHFLLGPNLHPQFSVQTLDDQVHILPPWIMLDFDVSKHEVNDLHQSLNAMHQPPMPPVPGPGFVHTKMDEKISFNLRHRQPDLPSGTAVSFDMRHLDTEFLEALTAEPPKGHPAVIEAALGIQPPQGYFFRPIQLPQDCVLEMANISSTSSRQTFNVTGPDGVTQWVAVLSMQVGHGLVVHLPVGLQPLVPSAAPGSLGPPPTGPMHQLGGPGMQVQPSGGQGMHPSAGGAMGPRASGPQGDAPASTHGDGGTTVGATGHTLSGPGSAAVPWPGAAAAAGAGSRGKRKWGEDEGAPVRTRLMGPGYQVPLHADGDGGDGEGEERSRVAELYNFCTESELELRFVVRLHMGDSNEEEYEYMVLVGSDRKLVASATATTKKDAKRIAASRALRHLKQHHANVVDGAPAEALRAAADDTRLSNTLGAYDGAADSWESGAAGKRPRSAPGHTEDGGPGSGSPRFNAMGIPTSGPGGQRGTAGAGAGYGTIGGGKVTGKTSLGAGPAQLRPRGYGGGTGGGEAGGKAMNYSSDTGGRVGARPPGYSLTTSGYGGSKAGSGAGGVADEGFTGGKPTAGGYGRRVAQFGFSERPAAAAAMSALEAGLAGLDACEGEGDPGAKMAESETEDGEIMSDPE